MSRRAASKVLGMAGHALRAVRRGVRVAARAPGVAGAAAAMGAALLLAACRGPETPPEAAPPTAARAERGTGAQAAKPSAPLVLRYTLLDAPRAGQPLRVRITVTPRRDAAALTVEAQGTAALVLTPPAYESPVDVRAGDSVTRDFTVVPVQHGRHRLRVVARGVVDGEPQAAGLVVPIQVGEEPAAAAPRSEASAAPRAENAAERVHSLPAEERRR